MTKSTQADVDVLLTLSPDRLDKITERELVQAFHDDGIVDLESLAERILKAAKEQRDSQSKELHPIVLEEVSRRTSPEVAANIHHATPEVPVVLDGVEYDPQDIQRLDGQALHFVLVNERTDRKYLHAFRDEAKPTIAMYLYMRRIASIVDPANWPPPSAWPPPQNPYIPGGGCGFMGAEPCHRSGDRPQPPPPPPFTSGQIQMFEHVGYQGNWFWLSMGFMWTDLRQVKRGGVFGGDWNDQISSLGGTNSTCQYFEHINSGGSSLIIPNDVPITVPSTGYSPSFTVKASRPIGNLVELGWNDRISSVINWP
jgi:hypothetical protein